MSNTFDVIVIRIPFNRPFATGDELDYVRAAIAAPKLSGDGPFTAECHRLLERSLGVQKALLTTSCTHALEMAALLLNLGPGDEVIVPAFTFPSALNAFVLRGAQPVFVDVRPDTLNIDETQIDQRITERTKAICLVHYAGVGCEMDTVIPIARQHSVAVVEDNAHGLCGKYRGRYLGTFGELATLSFHETKNFSCGEGGALLINDARFNERAEILREKGNRSKSIFPRRGGQVHVGRYRVELSALGHAGRIPPRTTRTPRSDSIQATTNLGNICAYPLPGPTPTVSGSRLSHPNANRLTTCSM